MAKKSKMAAALRKKRFSVRQHNRCPLCGRPRGYMRKFDMCRICFRSLSAAGDVPGVVKSSW